MVKEKTSALERAKKAAVQGKGKKSARGGSSSRTTLPKDWIQGDWMPSVIRQDDLDHLVEEGFIPHESARLPGKEVEPQPLDGECVLLATHIDRGFSLPRHPFFRSFLNFFGVQLHHLLPILLCILLLSFPCVKTSWVAAPIGYSSSTSSLAALSRSRKPSRVTSGRR